MINFRDSLFAAVKLFSSVVPCPQTQCLWLKVQVITRSHLLVVTHWFVLYWDRLWREDRGMSINLCMI